MVRYIQFPFMMVIVFCLSVYKFEMFDIRDPILFQQSFHDLILFSYFFLFSIFNENLHSEKVYQLNGCNEVKTNEKSEHATIKSWKKPYTTIIHIYKTCKTAIRLMILFGGHLSTYSWSLKGQPSQKVYLNPSKLGYVIHDQSGRFWMLFHNEINTKKFFITWSNHKKNPIKLLTTLNYSQNILNWFGSRNHY